MTVPVLMNIEKLCKIQNEANELLQSAMLDERGQNWKKVNQMMHLFSSNDNYLASRGIT